MNLFKRFTALLLAVLLVTGLFPAPVLAAEQEPLTFETTYINPIYADIVSEEDIPPVVTPKAQTYETVHYVTTMEDAGLVLREQMKARMASPVVHIFANVSTSEEFSALCRDLYEVAITHTREPDEGDYILWHLSGYKASGKRYTAEGGYNIDITYSMAYHSSAEQEAAVDNAVKELLSQLNLSGRSDYEKVKAVYDYICANVTYDHSDTEDTLKHTAYAALIKKTAVCQGYASLLYRLLLELGVDTRVIAGSTSGGDHGWNIVELDNLYYNADSTWDEGNTSYSWFLKSPANFPDHNRFAEYTTTAFTSAYPMASADYEPHPHSYSTAVTAPTCTEQGYTTYTCSCGDTYVGDYVDATGHNFGSWYQTKAPTEDEVGEEQRDCENCDVYETQEVEKLPHTHNYTSAITAPTCTDQGYTTYTCSCGNTYQDDFVDATGHSFGSWYQTKAPTEEETGEERRDCENCDVYETQEVEKLPHTHNYTSVITAPTCTNQGYTTYTCSCGNTYQDDFVDATGHSFGSWYQTIAPTEEAAGEERRDCANCDVYENRVIEKLEPSDPYSGACGENLTWEFDEETGTLTISGTGRMFDYIDDNVAPWYSYRTHITSVTIEDGVDNIGNFAFYCLNNLYSITIPESVKSIGNYAFCECNSLNSIIIPENVTSIGTATFAACTGLTSITIPASVTSIGEFAFSPCDNLTDIYFSGRAPVMESNVFYNVTATAYYHTNDPTWTSDVMQNYGGNITWIGYDGDSTYSGICGDNLTWAFNEESGKLSVSGSGAMYGADKLGWTAFAGDIRSVEIGNGATSVGAYAFADCTKLEDVQMPNSVLSIAYNAFENCSSLTAVDIPGNVTEIAYGAFMDCSSLTAVDIPDNVMEISYSAFKDCSSLASVELPQNVMSISYHAFDNCTSLSEVAFPASLASIGDEAFGSCTGLDEMHFTGNAPAIQSNAFSSVTADAYYPAANTTWTSDMLQNYGGSLTWIAEGGTVTPDNSCGENITWNFEESTGTLTISGTEPMARSNGSSVMDDYARPEDTPWFEYQDQIITVIIESTVDSIGKNAFAGCSNLTTVIIEEGVSEIDSTAFSDCESLENCFFEGTEDQWEDLGADIGESTLHTESAKPEAHTETKKTVAPTCTEKGYDLYTCSCGTTRKDNFTDPTGHKWNDGVITREPTAVAPGIRTFTCTVCKTTRTEEIPYEAPVVTGSVQRISGKDRVKTALSVAKALKDTLNVDKFDAVIIATGVNEKFADALAGSYLANRKKAPILLYTNSGLSQLNVNFIKENLKANGTVYILGGDSAVPVSVEQTLAAYNVVRLSGKTRYETNLAILKEAGISGNEILVATGTNFADSLSASAVGLPLLLVNGKNTAPNAVQTEFLKSVAGKKITIIGGDGAVSEEMKAAIEKITGVTAERISGKTRHNTSVMIAQKYFADADFALITYAKNFPDGLAGGPLAYAIGAPLLLTNAGQEGIAGEYITAGSIENGYILGGDSAVSDETARKVFGLAADAAIEKAYYTE